MKQHEWIISTLGHGETMCRNCFITHREAAVLGMLLTCDAPDQSPMAAPPEQISNDNAN